MFSTGGMNPFSKSSEIGSSISRIAEKHIKLRVSHWRGKAWNRRMDRQKLNVDLSVLAVPATPSMSSSSARNRAMFVRGEARIRVKMTLAHSARPGMNGPAEGGMSSATEACVWSRRDGGGWSARREKGWDAGKMSGVRFCTEEDARWRWSEDKVLGAASSAYESSKLSPVSQTYPLVVHTYLGRSVKQYSMLSSSCMRSVSSSAINGESSQSCNLLIIHAATVTAKRLHSNHLILLASPPVSC